MSFSLGIGIVTYNRKAIVSDTIDRVRAFTRHAGTAMVVADDGSSDATLAMLRDKQVPVVTGVNMGVAWNKNRALFLLSHMLGCKTVILLEDDTQPAQPGWEDVWIRIADRWGHGNFASPWMKDHIHAGAGSVEDPFSSIHVTAQCSVYSGTALTFGGYFDPHFRGFGHEHVEHSRRLIRVGFGGVEVPVDGRNRVTYFLFNAGLAVVKTPSFHEAEQEAKNQKLALALMAQQGYRAPWSDDAEMRQFRDEIETAMTGGPERFRLTPATEPVLAPRPKLWGQLVGQI